MDDIIWQSKTFEELNTTELYKIIQARIHVFVVEQHCHYPDLDDYDQAALHLWAESEGKILAYCRIFNTGIKYPETSIGRVLTTKLARRKNLGRQLMKYAIQIIHHRFGQNVIRISAQDYLINFYTDLGFLSTGKKYLEDDIPHTEMLLLSKKD